MLAELSWPIIERIHITGDFAVSPHGIFVAIGFLAGAQLMLKRAEWRGVARRPVANIPDVISAIVTRAAIGGIIGARLFHVLERLDQYDVTQMLRIWDGGLSLSGGIAIAVLANVPYMYRNKLSVPLLLDSMAPGLALGIAIGRIGDLIIGEHLGDRTDFALGWRCTGQYGRDVVSNAPDVFTGAQIQGCFDVAVHQTALYDMLTAALLLGLLLTLERRPRFDGFFGMTFFMFYGVGRLFTDFARASDVELIAGPLTGTQITAVVLVFAAVVWFLTARQWRDTPWAWVPGVRPTWTDPTVLAAEGEPVDVDDEAEPDDEADARNDLGPEDGDGPEGDGDGVQDADAPEAETDEDDGLGADESQESHEHDDEASV